MSSATWRARWDAANRERERLGLLRAHEAISVQDALHAEVRGRSCVLFSTNDYLGLGVHPDVQAAWTQAQGPGPRGSARVCGHTDAHRELEQALADHLRKEDALLFPTGFAANLSVIESLAGPDVDFYSDALNHASIVDGLRLAKRRDARVHVFPHGDTCALEDALRQARGRRVIVVDSVFSMDGDIAPLQRLAALRDAYDALLVVDEAHGSLVLGHEGAGAADAAGVLDRVDLVIGTLSKAFAAQGGYVAGDRSAITWLLNTGRSGIYSTALPLATVRAAHTALRIATSHEGARLRERVQAYRRCLEPASPAGPVTPILTLQLGAPARAMAAANRLWEHGLHVVGIRPPTVPEGTSRLRLSLSAGHQREEIQRLQNALTLLESVER